LEIYLVVVEEVEMAAGRWMVELRWSYPYPRNAVRAII
jgi:hypothetical protein